MKEWTGIEIEKANSELEQASATVLGRMLFEYARLDMNLGLMLVWYNHGRELEALTEKISSYSFHKKLELLDQFVNKRYADNPKVQTEYAQWLADSDITRVRRNELVHGRWGIDPIKAQVVNVVGLPTSSEQREIRYSIDELKVALEEMKNLQTRLQVLRRKSPI